MEQQEILNDGVKSNTPKLTKVQQEFMNDLVMGNIAGLLYTHSVQQELSVNLASFLDDVIGKDFKDAVQSTAKAVGADVFADCSIHELKRVQSFLNSEEYAKVTNAVSGALGKYNEAVLRAAVLALQEISAKYGTKQEDVAEIAAEAAPSVDEAEEQPV